MSRLPSLESAFASGLVGARRAGRGGKRTASRRPLGWVFAALLGMLLAPWGPADARTGTYRVVILRAFYTNDSTSQYTTDQMEQAAQEIHDYYFMLSNGELDVQVSVADATLSHDVGYYFDPCKEVGETRDPCPSPLIEDAAEAAAAGGFSFDGIDGIVLLSPFGGGDLTVGPITISRPGVNGTFQRSYDYELTLSHEFRLYHPAASGVFWGAWVHEIGHHLQIADGTPLGGIWNGHPSGYGSGYDLMDSCYPCGESGYSLSGPPVMNGTKRIFPGWLPSAKVKTVDPFKGSATVVLSPLSESADATGSYQVLKVPKFAMDFPNEYYLVQARIRTRADAARGNGQGIYDEGVQILDIDEYRDPPVRPYFPCDFKLGAERCITDASQDARISNCYLHLPDGDAIPLDAGDVPGYCWPYALWKVGETFIPLPWGNIQIRVDDRVEGGFVVTVSGGAGQDTPDPFIIPWKTLPMETYETVDIWIDSSCNGYESKAGSQTLGLLYGRRSDGTVIGNGDDPCPGHENRIYARIHNGGDGTAADVHVSFYVSEGMGPYIGGIPWMLVETASSIQFPALAALGPGETAEVYVPWTPPGPAGFELDSTSYPTAVKVVIEPVTGELVTTNQAAREDFGNVEIINPFKGKKYLSYKPFSWILNPFPDPRTFFLHVASGLPADWDVHLVDLSPSFTLGAGEMQLVTVDAIPLEAGMAEGGSVAMTREASFEKSTYPLEVEVRTVVTTENLAVPTGSPYRTHADGSVLGSLSFRAREVTETALTVSPRTDMTGSIRASGALSPAPSRGWVTLDYTDPDGNPTSRLAALGAGGTCEDTIPAAKLGTWSVRAIWQGDMSYAGALSEPVTVEVLPVPTVSPEGTRGTTFSLTGWGIGTKKPKVYAEYESGGKPRRKALKVTAWTDTSIECLWSPKLPPEAYGISLNIKGLDPIDMGTFTVKTPIIDAMDAAGSAGGPPVTVEGKFFSSKKPRASLRDPQTERTRTCKVLDWSMDPTTGASSLVFEVPDVEPGAYTFLLENGIGQAEAAFTVN